MKNLCKRRPRCAVGMPPSTSLGVDMMMDQSISGNTRTNAKRSSSFAATFFLTICVLSTGSLWLIDGFSFHVPRKQQTSDQTCRRSRDIQWTKSKLWMAAGEGGNRTVLFGSASATSERDVNMEQDAPFRNGNKMQGTTSSQLPDWLLDRVEASRRNVDLDVPRPTENGGFSHTKASRAKISAANKGKVPWNKGKERSEEVKARIAEGVRRRNRENFLKKLEAMGMTEEEYNAKEAAKKAEKEAKLEARKTKNGGYHLTEDHKKKISSILKEKWAKGEVKKGTVDPSKIRRNFTHSEETRARISAALKKKWADDEEYRETMITKMATAKAKDPEVIKRISETLKKKWEDPEFRANMTASFTKRNRGISVGKSHRQKISEAIKAKWQDEAYRKKATEAMARRQAELAKSRPERVKKPKVKKVLPATRVVAPMLVPPKKKKVKGVKVESTVENLNGLRAPIMATTVKKKKKLVKKKKIKVVAPAGSSLPPAVSSPSTASTATKPEAKTKTKNKKTRTKEEPGSVSRMREERRDLYDLLYGDEDDAGEDDFDDRDRGSVLPLDGDKLFDFDVDERLAKTMFLGDENLDEFDPYGLDDF